MSFIAHSLPQPQRNARSGIGDIFTENQNGISGFHLFDRRITCRGIFKAARNGAHHLSFADQQNPATKLSRPTSSRKEIIGFKRRPWGTDAATFYFLSTRRCIDSRAADGPPENSRQFS